MTREDHLLVITAEEGAEIAQRATKALRFGMDEMEPGQDRHNSQRLVDEMRDLMEMFRMMENAGMIGPQWRQPHPDKRAKVEQYLELSRELGRLEP